MKLINNSKLSIKICNEEVKAGKSIIVKDDVWVKEYASNSIFRTAIANREIIAKPTKKKKG